MVNVNTPIKLSVISLGAVLATCLCFYVMLFLISRDLPTDIELTTSAQVIPRMAEQREEEPVPMRERPKKVLPLDPPPDIESRFANRTAQVALSAELPTFGSLADLLGPADINLELEAPMSELMPISVVQPIYPLSAAMREIEGYVIVEFSVRENGTVINPIIVRSEPAIMFDEAALNAVSRFKFKPREIAGEKVRVDNVQLKFAFNLESLYAVDDRAR